MTRDEKIVTAVGAFFAVLTGASWNWMTFIIGFAGLALCVGLLLASAHRGSRKPPRGDAPNAVEVVVDFLISWHYCPLATSDNASRADLEDVARQLLDALATAGSPGDHVRVALGLLRQAAPAIEKERSTRLDGPLMSVLDARDELEKAVSEART